MGVLKYAYHCNDCNKEKYSYFADVPYCVYCNSKNISKTYIGDRNIDKFSDEGRKMIREGEKGE